MRKGDDIMFKDTSGTVVYVFFIVLTTFLPQKAFADEIVMENGLSLKGTVTSLSGAHLVLTSDYADPIKLKTSKIISIKTEKPVDIQMNNGVVLKGYLNSGVSGPLVVEQIAGMGIVVIDMKNILAINPPPANQWSGSIIVAGNYQTGNSDRSALRLGSDAVRRSDKDRFTVKCIYDIANEAGKLRSRSMYGSLKYDLFFSKVLYGYLGVDILSDTFQDLNVRTIAGPGAGYQIWDDPKKALAFEAGFSIFSEDHKNGEDVGYITARIAANFRYKITDTMMLTNNLILFPGIESISDFHLRNEAAVSTTIGSGWALKLANTIEYNNSPEAGIHETDSNFVIGLQYLF